MRVAILGSGRGSNAEALLRAQAEGRLGRARIIGLWSDLPDAGILGLGPRHGVPATHLDPGPFRTKFSPEREAAWAAALKAAGAELVEIKDFPARRDVGAAESFPRRILNLHPTLLPAFPGLDGIGQAFRRGVKITGCTVHHVTLEVDGGPILDQAAVRIEETDTLETLARKVHAAEHALLPATIARLSERHG